MGINSAPVTLHKYLYANADPVNNTDPTGMFTMAQTMQAVNVVSTLATVSQASQTLFSHATGDVESSSVDLGIEILFDLLPAAKATKLFKLVGKKSKNKGPKNRYVAKPATLESGHLIIGGKKLTFTQSLIIVRAGGDVIAKTKDWARKIAKTASGGRKPIGAERHLPKSGDGRWPAEPVVYRWHYHPKPRNGSHIFY